MTIILKFLFLFLDVAKDEIEVRDEYDFAIMKRKISDDNTLRVIVEYDTNSEPIETEIDLNETPNQHQWNFTFEEILEMIFEPFQIMFEPYINLIRIFPITLLHVFIVTN